MILLICIALYFAFPVESPVHRFAKIILWIYAILLALFVLGFIIFILLLCI